MTILPPPAVIQRVLDTISTIANLLTLLISLSLLCIIIYQLIRSNSIYRKEMLKDMSIRLSMNTHCLLIIRSIFQFFDIDLNTIKRDYLSIQEFNNSFLCRFRGYLLLSIHNCLYWSYTIQAIFRFIRVIFPHYIYLFQSKIRFCILIFIQFFFGFISIFPIFIGFNDIYLLPNEPYCTASFNELTSLTYMPILAFGLPLSTIVVCYLCITWKIRRITTTIRPYQQRNRRDFIVIHRMILLITILSMVSLPLFIDLFIHLAKGYIDPYMNSIGWVSSSINAVILVISLPFINPKLYELLKRKSNIVQVQ
ncbi:unnamed protein product [Rotaria sordida]|uniref:G-protein coupled receptors family 1 profile domain-containing protein n=2 Tax=Rotaria sordida TaxID=392033 RepID=A0A814X1U7_9BILA|nr:unnamed protein product [Rotaria sordida]